MRTLIAAALLCCVTAAPSMAQSVAACKASATEKKLAGAAQTSFLKKCEADAKAAAEASCDKQAADKKLNGAAKTSFTKKCVSDAVGT